MFGPKGLRLPPRVKHAPHSEGGRFLAHSGNTCKFLATRFQTIAYGPTGAAARDGSGLCRTAVAWFRRLPESCRAAAVSGVRPGLWIKSKVDDGLLVHFRMSGTGALRFAMAAGGRDGGGSRKPWTPACAGVTDELLNGGRGPGGKPGSGSVSNVLFAPDPPPARRRAAPLFRRLPLKGGVMRGDPRDAFPLPARRRAGSPPPLRGRVRVGGLGRHRWLPWHPLPADTTPHRLACGLAPLFRRLPLKGGVMDLTPTLSRQGRGGSSQFGVPSPHRGGGLGRGGRPSRRTACRCNSIRKCSRAGKRRRERGCGDALGQAETAS